MTSNIAPSNARAGAQGAALCLAQVAPFRQGWSRRAGRCLLVFSCYDEHRQGLYLLKGDWRDQNTPNDVVRDKDAEPPSQTTTLHDLVSADQGVKDAPIRHRQCLKRGWRPLCTVNSSREMMYSTYQAFLGHERVYVDYNILHRDISLANIVIVDRKAHHHADLEENEGQAAGSGSQSTSSAAREVSQDGCDEYGQLRLHGDLAGIEGVLVDWDLISDWDVLSAGTRQRERKGSWRYMSKRLCKEGNDVPQTVQDDMESFMHVVLFLGLRYFEHSLSGPQSLQRLAEQFRDIFGQYEFNVHGQATGGRGKQLLMFAQLNTVCSSFSFASPGLEIWIGIILFMLDRWYNFLSPYWTHLDLLDLKEPDHNMDALKKKWPIKDDMKLKDHKAIRQLFESLLLSAEKWPVDEVVEDHIPKAYRYKPAVTRSTTSSTPPSDQQSQKRKSEGSNCEEPPAKRSRGPTISSTS